MSTIQPRTMWVLQTVDESGNQQPLVEWMNALQMFVQTDSSCTNIEVAGEIKGKEAEKIISPNMMAIRKEIELNYAEYRKPVTSTPSTRSQDAARETSPVTITEFPPDVEDMIVTETKARFGNQIKSSSDRETKRGFDRIKTNVTALKFCCPEIQAIIKATIGEGYMSCRDIKAYMKALAKGYNSGREDSSEYKHKIETLRVNFKQAPEESLSEAMQRYKDTVTIPMANLEMPAQSPVEEASSFIRSLLAAYDPMKQRIKQNEAKLKKIPRANPAYPAALLLYGPPGTIEEAYELALAEGVAVIPKAAFNTIELDEKEKDKKKKPKKDRPNYDKPPRVGCRFCDGEHWERECPAKREAVKAYREKNGLPAYVPSGFDKEKPPPKKTVTLDLTRKEIHTTTIAVEDETTSEGSDEDMFQELNRLMNEFPDEYGQFSPAEDFHDCDEGPRETAPASYATEAIEGFTMMRADNNANTQQSPTGELGMPVQKSHIRIQTSNGVYQLEYGYKSPALGEFQINPGSNEYILCLRQLMRILEYRVVGCLGEMDFYFERPDGTIITMEARYDETDCMKIKVPHSVFKPAAIVRATVNATTRFEEGQGPFGSNRGPKKFIFSTISKMVPGQLEKEIAEAAIFTKRELEAEKVARRAQDALGFMSAADMVQMVGSGGIINFPVNSNVLRSATWKRAEILKGKSHMRASTTARTENAPVPDPNRKQTPCAVGVDIIFDQGQAFLLGVTQPVYFMAKEDLGYVRDGVKSAHDLQAPLANLISQVKAKGFAPYEVIFDSEGGVAANRGSIENSEIALRMLPSGTKNGPFETKVKTLKERVRTITQFVQQKMNICQMMVCFFFTLGLLSMNISPTSSNPHRISPYRAATGHQVDFDLIGKGVVGDIVEAQRHLTTQANRTDEERTITAVILSPDPNCFGAYWLMNVNTGRPFRRTNFDIIQATPEILEKIEVIAKRTSMPRNFRDTTDNNGDRTFNKKGTVLTKAELAADAKNDEFELFPGDISREYKFFFDDKGAQIPGPGEITPSQLKSPREGVEIDMLPKKAIDYARAAEEVSKFVLDEETTVVFSHTVWKHPDKPKCVPYSALKTGDIWTNTHNLKAAVKEYGQKETYASLIKEIDGMLAMKVFHGVAKSSLSSTQIKKTIRCSTFFKEKLKDGIRASIKARLVADGSHQDPTIYDRDKDISAPTVATSSVFTILANAAAKDHHVITFDIGMAYLNAEMDPKAEVHMYLDPISATLAMQKDPTLKQYVLEDGRIIVKLDKALYGCIESARRWYETLKDVLLKRGYKVNPVDVCVFSKLTPSGDTTNVCFHVDDGLATSPDPNELEALAAAMNSAFTEVKYNQGPVQEYLGMKLDFSRPKSVLLTMEKYIVDFTSELFPDLIGSSAKSPADERLFEIDPLSERLPEIERKHFHRGVAQSLYLATRVRPDILASVIFLTTRVGVATIEDQSKLKRLVRYLMGTSELGLNLGGNDNGEVQLVVYPDASFGVHANGRSHSGICITLGRGAILSKSGSQHIVTKSSCESELVTLSDSASLGMYLKNFMHEAGMGDTPGIFREDNMSTIKMTKNGRSNSDRTKHINIRYFFVKQFLDSGDFTLEHCPTENQIADILTKPLQGEHFERLRDLLLGYTLQ